jgi:GTP-binding protein
MKPTLVLVGRPNVGKSTLFNRLTKSRDAIVADMPGLTRDRHYGHGKLGSKPYLVVDTGGFEPLVKDGIMHEMARQTEQAIAEADAVIFVVDGRSGDAARQGNRQQAASPRVGRCLLRLTNRKVMNSGMAEADFHELGLGEPNAISAAHGEGVRGMVDLALASLSRA